MKPKVETLALGIAIDDGDLRLVIDTREHEVRIFERNKETNKLATRQVMSFEDFLGMLYVMYAKGQPK